jgi:hypothetical protein
MTDEFFPDAGDRTVIAAGMEQRAWHLVEMRRLLGVTQNCRLWAGGRRLLGQP